MVWSREIIGWRTHVLTAFLGLCWSVVMFVYDIRDIIYANVAPNDPNFNIANLARDQRYCLYYFGQPNTDLLCTMTAPCTGSAVDPSTFMPNGPFVYRFALNLLLIVMICYAFWLAFIWKRKVIDGVPEVAVDTGVAAKVRYLSRFETELKK